MIINPAAGQKTPVLATLNSVFQPLGIDWDISITKKAGDARQQAQWAVQSGVDIVAAYGGDGTVTEVASGLLGSDVPLAILPGGTGNVMSIELGIPPDLGAACLLAAGENSAIQRIDCGQVNEHFFLLRLSVGLEAEMIEATTREAKERYGIFAYLWSALQNLRQPEIAQYHMMLDGQEILSEGVTCVVANSANLGLAGVKLLPTVDISDGKFDVIVIQQANLTALFEILGGVLGLNEAPLQPSADELNSQLRQSLQVWQAKAIQITTTPALPIQVDGEIIGEGRIQCNVLPQALRVIVPDVSGS
ncbi:MAG: diacylglycerol kinase family lipid kinase [Caldilineaceae bacterium]